MATPSPSPPFVTRFDPQTGRAVTVDRAIVRITAPNGGPYTFTGTNTFLLGTDTLAVLDPGPDDPAHLAALERAISGRPVGAIILTHTHRDHSGLARRLKQKTGAPIWSGGPHRLSRPRRQFEINPFGRASDFDLVPDRVLHQDETLNLDGLSLAVIETPGHCANHLCFAVSDADWLFTGDHVMGWSSTVIGVPDGGLGAYLGSLDRVIGLEQSRYFPAHGAPIEAGRDFARALKAHRLMRNGQILDALANGRQGIGALVRTIYPDLRGRLAIAARQTLIAHLEYLEDQGRIALRRWPWGLSARLLG